MYWWDVRQRARLFTLANAFLDRRAEEEITHAVYGYVKPRTVGSFLINLIPGGYGSDFSHHWLLTTNRRVVFVSLTSLGKPTRIEWQRPREKLEVTKYRPAVLSQL